MAFSFTPQQQQQSPFQPSPFSQTTPFQQQQQQFQFQPQQPQLQQQQTQQLQQQQQQQQHLYLFTNDKSPATYSTKWDDLHPDSRKLLHQIEEKILEYRDESQRLDQCSRLYDSSVSSQGLELDASQIVQELGGISMSMERQKAILQELMTVAKDMLRNAEVSVRSYIMLRPRFLHQNKAAAASATSPLQTSGATVTLTSSNPPPANSVVPVFDFYSGIPKKPSPFLQQTIARFEKYLSDCRQWIEELEQLIILDSDKNSSNSSSSLLQSLPNVMSNVHDFFVHVAAKVESTHQYIESMKTAYLADQRRRGDGNDPFLEADRRETAKQEAAARRVHPTLHLPTVSQPSTQVAGLLTISPATGASTTPSMFAAASASSGSGTSLFATPSATTSLSLFSTPTTSAPVSSLFASSGATPQTSPFGSLSVSTSGFGTSAPLFSSTPSGLSTFSTPFGTGAATGSGASFGTISKARAKSRTARR